jgi:hypothetical protein
MNSLIATAVLLISMVGCICCISIPVENYRPLILNRCFNETYDRKPLVLGQRDPVGLSIENLISLIEKVERKKPELSAKQIIVLIMRRFHIDGLQTFGGENAQSNVEMLHRRITDQIVPSETIIGSEVLFPEDALTEDEKCALFFTISHTINETARYDEDPTYTFQRVRHTARAPPNPMNPSISPINQTLNTSKPIQSDFLKPQPVMSQGNQPKPTPARIQPPAPQESKQESDDDKDESRFKRSEGQSNKSGQTYNTFSPNVMTVTKYPREKGVASFRNSRQLAIAANRVLLGIAVGLISPPTRTTRDIIKAFGQDINLDRVPDGQMDPLLAVTLSDLLGIDAGAGLVIPAGQILFGAEGEWNSTACQTSYRLKTNGTLATLAEMRGGLDGWNIGRKLPEIVAKNPKITLSQILRMYYSARGLTPDSGVCNRQYGITTDLQNKIPREAENYIRIWNGVYYFNRHPDTQLTGFVSETWNIFNKFLQKAGQDKTSEERDFCNPPVGTDMRSFPCESSADVFFMLDNMPAEGTGNREEIEIITQVVKTLNLGKDAGSVSVLVNAQGSSNPSIVDENNMQLNPPLYALAYNTTSSQCASCRAAWFDNRQTSITDRPLLLELINKTLMEYESKKADLPGVSSKSFVWFDYGSLKQAPTDREQKKKYDDFKWRLRYEHRDVTFFMATINKDSVKDLLRRDEDWIQVGKGVEDAAMRGTDLANKICQTPSTFQHNECRVKKSEGKVYEGFITPGYRQYWAMYPEYFIKSYNIDLKFKAENAKIKVCFERYLTPEPEDRRCIEAKEESGEVKWTVKNPCQGKTFENCPAFYFTIGLSTQSGSFVGSNCTDSRCRSIDQVKWTFTHTGVSCNSSYSLLPSWTFQIISFILFLTIFFINNKHD